MKKEAILSIAVSGTISVVFGVIGIFEARKHAKQQREALCAQLHADILGEETQMVKDMVKDIKEFKEKNNTQQEEKES